MELGRVVDQDGKEEYNFSEEFHSSPVLSQSRQIFIEYPTLFLLLYNRPIFSLQKCSPPYVWRVLVGKDGLGWESKQFQLHFLKVNQPFLSILLPDKAHESSY